MQVTLKDMLLYVCQTGVDYRGKRFNVDELCVCFCVHCKCVSLKCKRINVDNKCILVLIIVTDFYLPQNQFCCTIHFLGRGGMPDQFCKSSDCSTIWKRKRKQKNHFEKRKRHEKTRWFGVNHNKLLKLDLRSLFF